MPPTRQTYQTALYLAIDKKTIFVNSKRSPQPIPIAEFTLLLSTTDEYSLLQPLRDRIKLTLRFEYYSEAELTLLLRHRCKALDWELDKEVLPFIAHDLAAHHALPSDYCKRAVALAGVRETKL